MREDFGIKNFFQIDVMGPFPPKVNINFIDDYFLKKIVIRILMKSFRKIDH